MTVQLQKATLYYNQRAVMGIFPLAPDQTIVQMWSNGARGGNLIKRNEDFIAVANRYTHQIVISLMVRHVNKIMSQAISFAAGN